MQPGRCHSHRLYSHICDRSQSMLNSHPTQMGAVNNQSGSKIQWGTDPDYSVAICSKLEWINVGGGNTCDKVTKRNTVANQKSRGLCSVQARKELLRQDHWSWIGPASLVQPGSTPSTQESDVAQAYANLIALLSSQRSIAKNQHGQRL